MNNIFTQEFINSVSGSLTTPAMLQEKRLKQPLHTVYGGAQMFTIETFDRIRETALRQFNTYAANPAVLKQIFPATGVLNSKIAKNTR
ncbi:MAG: hypothetical protein HYV28_15060 [Ignavibacteriales bacterium]|nr:hypothetical protein [Ignavibacteriales bacterium]